MQAATEVLAIPSREGGHEPAPSVVLRSEAEGSLQVFHETAREAVERREYGSVSMTITDEIKSEAPRASMPEMDRARCSECMRTFKVKDLPTEEEGGGEEPVYTIHICPKCEDGGCIDDYYPSKKSLAKWRKEQKAM